MCPTHGTSSSHLLNLSTRDAATAQSNGECFATSRPERFIEQFMEHTWADHLRHHDRMTMDRALQLRVQQFHRGEPAPIVTHYAMSPVPLSDR